MDQITEDFSRGKFTLGIFIDLPKAFDTVKHNTRFFTGNNFISNTRLKLAKNQAKAKQHP